MSCSEINTDVKIECKPQTPGTKAEAKRIAQAHIASELNHEIVLQEIQSRESRITHIELMERGRRGL